MNDILNEFKNLHHFQDSWTFGLKAVLETKLVDLASLIIYRCVSFNFTKFLRSSDLL